MATKSISQLDTQATANETDLFEVAIVDANSASGYASKKESAAAIADAIVGAYQYPLRITGTTAKTIAGAINELKNLVDLLPQFAIEVVSSLPVSDISTTTIYLVPASDPEQGNYYEEYIYVNNAWELVGTTAVDLTGYYTSAQVDTLLAAKADSSSLATVATSGAYSDLTGKPTIDTALDDTSTNAVENRAVASEINSIKSDITVEGSASGDIATFVDGSDNPLKELKISIEAVQSGSGDPSPTNVRPISGWTGCDINNKKDDITITDTVNGYWDSDGVSIVSSSSRMISRTYYPINGTKTIYFDVTYTGGSSTMFSQIVTYNASKVTQRVINFGTPPNEDINETLTVQPSEVYFRVSFPSSSIKKLFVGDSLTISWQTEAGTVYGGTLNPLSGILTAEYAIVDIDDLNLSYYAWGSANCFSVRIAAAKDEFNAICSVFKKVPAIDIYNNRYDLAYCSNQKFIRIIDSNYTDATALKAAYAGQKLVYELATPVTYQLTPTEVRSLLGVNNVWADCGAITELKYTRDLNLCINDIIARIEALEGASSSRSLSVSSVLTKSIVSDSDKTEGKIEEETEEETKEEARNER